MISSPFLLLLLLLQRQTDVVPATAATAQKSRYYKWHYFCRLLNLLTALFFSAYYKKTKIGVLQFQVVDATSTLWGEGRGGGGGHWVLVTNWWSNKKKKSSTTRWLVAWYVGLYPWVSTFRWNRRLLPIYWHRSCHFKNPGREKKYLSLVNIPTARWRAHINLYQLKKKYTSKKKIKYILNNSSPYYMP